MHIIGLLLFSFGILLILFGISIFTPVFSWFGKKFNSSNFSHVNYNQPNSIRNASLFMGICFFVFGIFITFASAAFLHMWKTSNSQNLLNQNPVPQATKIFATPMISAPNKPAIKYENNSSVPQFRLDCQPDIEVLNMREKANLNAKIILSIPCDAIEIQDKEQRYFQDGVEWFLVKYQEKTGWVAGKYLKKQATNSNKTNSYSQVIAKKRP